MNSSQQSVNMLQILGLGTCQDIEDFLKELNTGEYELRNMTRDEYIDSLRSPHCQPKPYPIPYGMKRWIIAFVLIAFLVSGLIGNLLSATIMFRRSRRGLSAYFYLGLLAIIDICVLYSSCLLYLLEITFDYHPQTHSGFHCRLSFYIQHLFTYISAWLIVAVTFERFIVVRYPFQSIRICRLSVAYTIASIIFGFFSIYTAHCFFTMNLIKLNLQTDAGYHPQHAICDVEIYRQLLSVVDLCFYSVIPSVLILIFNVLIIITMFYTIKKQRDYLQANSYAPGNVSNRNKNKSQSTARTQFIRSRSAESSPAMRSYSQINKQRIEQGPGNNKFLDQSIKPKTSFDPTSATGIRLTCLLLIISFIFVLCTLPISIRSLVSEYLPSQKSTMRWQMTQVCLTLLMFLNHTINFVLYCLTGRTFRTECHKLICSMWMFNNFPLSCTVERDSDKNQTYPHHQLLLIERNRLATPNQYQQHQRLSPSMKGCYV
ncbi:unnamed protein product [Adineta ricciae]|nr:unnamed protein product [Adineta ricciae]